MSARAHELPETVLSRCHVVTFTALSETFVVDVLVGEGVDETRARLAARLAGGNLGRARRLATAADGLRVPRGGRARASRSPSEGPTGALEAADVVLAAAAEYKKGLKAELETALAPFVDEKGRPEDAYRGAIKRIETRFQRRERRAERDYIDWVLLAVSSLLRDRIASADRRRPRALHEPRPGAGRPAERRASGARARRDRAGAGRPGRGSQPQPAPAARTRVPPSGRAGARSVAVAAHGLWCWHYWRSVAVGWDAGGGP